MGKTKSFVSPYLLETGKIYLCHVEMKTINLVKAQRSLFERHFTAHLYLELFCWFHSPFFVNDGYTKVIK